MGTSRWRPCFADVLANRYGAVVTAFMDGAVKPSLASMDRQVADWRASSDPIDAFRAHSTETLLRATTSAFALSLQSLWERQFRTYLRGCAVHLKAGVDTVKRSEAGKWNKLEDLFHELRGVVPSTFDAWPALVLLNKVGSACRHGDGSSAQDLMKEHPEWWPRFEPNPDVPPPPPEDILPYTVAPTSFNAAILPRDLLTQSADAIVDFWLEVDQRNTTAIIQGSTGDVAHMEKWLADVDNQRAALKDRRNTLQT